MLFEKIDFSRCTLFASLLGLKLLLNVCAAAQAELAPLPSHQPQPLHHFYRDYLLEDFELSPDGTHLLALKNVGGTTALMVLELKTGNVVYPTKTDNKEFKFNWVKWANNDRVLMSVRFSSKRDVHSGLRFDETRLLATDAKRQSKIITLVKPVVGADNGWSSQIQDYVISILPDDPDHILVSVDRDAPMLQSVYKVNVYTGMMSLVKRHRSGIRNWMADRNGDVRIGIGYDDKERLTTIQVYDAKADEWQVAWQYVVFDEPAITPAGFGSAPNELFLFADHNGRQALYKADLGKPGFPMELVIADDEYDISGRLIYSSAHKEVVGVYYADDADRSIFWNKDFQQFQRGIDRALPDRSNHLVSLSDDARKALIFSSGVQQPGSVYFLNRDLGDMVKLGDILPELNEQVLVKKQLLKYKARDGLELEGYLSLPKDFNDQPIATILLPHGGPMAEDGQGFDRFSAFLVDRGYAVFQPNFRGSSGRGHDFMTMAVGAYGLAMQDDLADAVKFLVAQKVADPNKVGIMGASYGGYAALMGATKTPDLFRCAISFAGLSDLVKFRDTFKYYANKHTYREQFGHDKEQLYNTSPANMADKVKIPILLIHGKDDTSVPVQQSRLMAERLQSAGKNVEYIELENGTHHLDYLPHRQQSFEAIDRFLAKYLPL